MNYYKKGEMVFFKLPNTNKPSLGTLFEESVDKTSWLILNNLSPNILYDINIKDFISKMSIPNCYFKIHNL